jgi:putative membrane protein
MISCSRTDKTMRCVSIIVALAAATPCFGGEPIGNPAGMLPSSPLSAPGKPAPNESNVQDRLFVHLAGSGGMAEVQAGKLAEGRAQNAAVRSFAQMMVQDHAKTNERLSGIAKKAGIPLPPRLAPDHDAMLAELKGLSGAQFDLAYMQHQLVEHQKTVQLLQWAWSMGQNAELQKLAAESLPTVLQHLEMAQSIMGQLTGAGPQGLAAYASPAKKPAAAR